MMNGRFRRPGAAPNFDIFVNSPHTGTGISPRENDGMVVSPAPKAKY
jgi:hypothetical protein